MLLRYKFFNSILLIIVINIIAIGLIALLFNQIRKSQEILFNAKQDLNLIEAKLELASSLQFLINENKENQERINASFVKKDNIVSFIKELERLGKLSGIVLRLNSATVSNQTNKEPSFSLFLKGGLENIFKYLSLLELMPFQIRIEQINLQKSQEKEKDKPGFWESNLELKLLSYVNE